VPDKARCLIFFACLFFAACASQTLVPDAAIRCDSCEDWNEPHAPFRVFGNTYYVGTAGLSSILIETVDGLMLIDGGLPQSAPQIAQNIRRLGFDARDIRVIAVSHAHFDHVGGIAALQRFSGASVAASPDAARVLRRGASFRDDPQFGPDLPSFPPVGQLRHFVDGSVIDLGVTRLRGVPTPGHTSGGMTWTWQECEDDHCLDIVYADSLSPVSRPGYRFSDGMGDRIRQSASLIAALNCDIFLSTHDFSFGLHEKLALGRDAFIDPDGCKSYAARALQRLERRLERESAEP
jgi:metallo-beta-lactamase class B